MGLARLGLEMEGVYVMATVRIVQLFLRLLLSNEVDIVGDADHAVVRRKFLVDFVIVHFVHSDVIWVDVIQFSPLDQSGDDIRHIAVLGDKDFKLFLTGQPEYLSARGGFLPLWICPL